MIANLTFSLSSSVILFPATPAFVGAPTGSSPPGTNVLLATAVDVVVEVMVVAKAVGKSSWVVNRVFACFLS